MGRRSGEHIRWPLRPSGGPPGPRSRRPGPTRRPRARSLALLVALVTALTAAGVLADGAQAKKAISGQHVIVHVSCEKVTYLFLGFPEGVTNEVHEKVKLSGKVVNKYKEAFKFYGSIGEGSVTLEVPATGEYLIQAGATWDTNGDTGESTTTKQSDTCNASGSHPGYSIEKVQRLNGEASYTPEELHGKLGQLVEYHVIVRNTGDKPLEFSNFQDANCEKLKGGPTKELAPTEAATYVCVHELKELGVWSNEASVEANEGTGKQSSNTVKVDVPAEPEFTLTKEQKVAGEAAYTKSELTTELGKTIDYKIVVKNTGNVNLKFSEFVDGNCENVKGGPGEAELKPGESATYTCEHTDNTVGKYPNQATATGTPPMGLGFPVTESSNKVEVNVAKKATFTIEKLQRVGGAGSYTKNEITGADIGQLVEYHVVVKNTGNVSLHLEALSDPNCEVITGGANELAPGAETTFSCQHTLAAVGSYSNEATIEGNEGAGTKTSNKVTVKVSENANFTIEKLQRVTGEALYTKNEVTGKTGQTVEYEIVVKNTGNVELTFNALADGNCTGINPPGTTELAPAAEETFNCTHVLGNAGTYTNEASIEGSNGTGTKTSNVVTAKIISAPSFTVEKRQRLGGSGPYTTGPLSGEPGETVEYQIVVKDNGNTTLKFSALKDTGCSGVSPSGTTELTAGQEETFTCTHVLSVGTYTNEASIKANEGGEETSNKVTVSVAPEPAFTIEKLEKISGEGSFTATEHTGEVGETADYEVVVKNTGNVPLTFANFSDANCSNIKGGPSKALEPGESATYTCEHALTAAGSYSNQASVEAQPPAEDGVPFTHTSNTVVVNIPEEPEFTIAKLQRIKGEANYTVSELNGKIGQTVEYKIVVDNTGNMPLTFTPLSDSNCEGITPSGTTELAPGKEEAFTCTHVLTAVGKYHNKASIEANDPIKHESNEVTVEVKSEPSFSIEKLQRIKGEANYSAAEKTAERNQTVEYKIIVKNTGNVTLKFTALKDTACEGLTPSGTSELKREEEETFTCTHVLAVGSYTNEATIEGNEETGSKSSKVTVDVPVKATYTIEKQQRLAGEPFYTVSELTGELGETVEYQIIVNNTGNVPLKFGALKDANCEGITPSGATEVPVGFGETFLCSHQLTAVGNYTNEASIEATEGGTRTTNKVTVRVPTKPSFTIEKAQRLHGEAGYGQAEKTGKLGQTIEYKITVKNTGNMPLKFGALKDANCEGITPSGTTELAIGKEESFTCSHVLAVGTTTNEASIEGNEGTGKQTSNKVTAKVEASPSYKIEKLQRIAGEGSYGAGELSGKLGQTVEYEIVVKNTGNLKLKFGALKDSGCEGITPSGTTEVGVNEEESFTCTHTLAVGTTTNEASIEGNEGTGKQTSNKVTAKVEAAPSYTIEKLQRLKGEASYTSSEKFGKLGQTVEYKIVVKNTGNLPLKFTALTDAGCEGITPSGTTELAVGKEESFTCTHILAVGTTTNEASIEGNEGTGKQTSNKVVATVEASPAYTIEKQQKIAGESNYTTGELSGKLGQTVEYKITVKNTGNLPLKFTALSDSGCEGITPSGATELAVGKEESFTCTHTLAVGSYSNEASIESNEGTGKQTSNKVTVKVASEPSYTIEKLQKIAGEGSYTTAEKTGKLGQTVEYKIVVKNTGNLPLKFTALSDSGCEGITPSGTTELAVGKEESFTCSHTLAVGTTANEASIEGNEGTGKQTSNKVTVKVAAEPSYAIEKLQRLKGEANYAASELKGELGQTVEYKISVKNTGNVPLKFAALKDATCEGITPSGATELQVGEEESFTCTHVLAVGTTTNEASIEGNEGTGTKTSNKVTAKVAAEPNFTIEKLQRIQGESSYVSSAKSGKAGQTVEYKIVVKNTGNLPLKFAALKDSGCTGITPSGATELAVGAEESFTCSNTLAVGANNNEASIEGNEGTGTKTSNKVTTTVASEPTFSIEKFQKIAGEPTYTTSKITGSLGQTVEYKVVVTNTGNVPLKFAALKDTGCEGVTPPGTTELAAGKSESFTCTHTLGAVGKYVNEASIEGNESTGTKTSNKVEAEVPAEPSYAIEKLQRIAGEPTYGAAEVTGKLGQAVEYKIVVKNTGNVTLKFGALSDANCSGISPSGATEVKAGKEETFTCSHTLGVGSYSNEASIEGNEGTGKKTSNKVVAKVASEPSYTIEKQQKIAGESSYATAEKTGKLGQTVEYKITVKNTGNLKLKFSALKDSACEGISPSGTTELAVGAEESFTCSHVLAVGSYTNEASIEGNEGTGTKTSNKVVAKVPAEPSYTIEKQQKIAGEGSFGTGEVSGKIGQTVEYKIVVKNTGNLALKFTALTDSGCEGVSPSGTTELAVGKEESFTCSHKLSAVGSYSNEASIEGNEGTGKQTSNKVTAKVPAEPSYTIEKQQKIAGESSYATAEKTGKIGQTVEYKIVVKNTGNVPLKFTALKDSSCGSISPSGATEVAAGGEESFTCTHTLSAVGSYTNEASIEGNEGTGTKTSNKVVAKVAAEPSYTIEKLQKIQGEGTFGTSEVSGKLGQTVEYKITVKNTGNVALKFAALKDSGCEGLSPSGTTELAAGSEESFSCTHKLSAVGSYSNEASIEGNEGTGTKTSNKVTAKVPAEPSYTIEKQQKIEGTFGTGEVSGKLGQTIEYKVVVKNTGNVPLKFAALKDSGCEGLSPSGATELAAGAEESFTCTHKLSAVGSYNNEASIEGNEGTGTKTSNKVTAKVPAEPSYTIEKQQKIAGEGSYSSTEHSGKAGQVVEYKIIVRNTGNVALKFAALKDSNCSSISPSGSTELAAGGEESFTCTHTLSAVGSYSNEASIEGNEGTGTKTSNKVTAKVPAEPSFTIEKQQKVAGEGSYTTSEKSGKAGQAVEYKIIVKNTGNETLKFTALKDSNCSSISPSGATELGAGGEESFTCTHTLSAVGSYSNEASIEGNEGTGTKTSNKVTAKVPAEPSYTIEKLQKIAGEGSYSSSEKSGKVGQVVEYKIVVRNTGNVPLKFSALKDSDCGSISPSGTTEVAAGGEESFTCTHTLSAVGSYSNEASIEGNEGTGTKTSNKVTASVAAEPSFSIEKLQKLAGESSYGVAEKSGTVGQTVEYKVVVKNTGNVPLKFSALKDSGCSGISPSTTTELAAGAEESFTCTHTSLAVGSYSNEASIEGNEGTGTKTSNKVTVKVPPEPAFTIEKQQKIAGESSYTTAEKSGKAGQTVEYKVIVKNTGNVTLKFGALKDTGCEGISPSGTTELAPGKEESFTCTHKLSAVGSYTNEASIEGNEGIGIKTSNKVVAKVPAEPSFTVEKLQKIAGESSYSTGEKNAQGGQTDEYKIVVKNTGNVPLKFGALKDTGCEGISPSGATEVAAGGEESFTCTHTFTNIGTYSNEASIEGNEGTGTRTSNKVSAKVTAKAAYTIQKLQRIKGESSYTSSELSAEIGQVVEYEIVVKNTGNESILFGELKDSQCSSLSPSGSTELQPGKEETFTCSHTLTAVGTYSNEASIEACSVGTQTSNKVTVKVTAKPSFTIEKQQKIAGESSYSTAEKGAETSQTMDYLVVVKNTGNVALKFSALKDSGCEGILPSGTTELAAGKEESFTCSHSLSSAGTYTNEASIEGNEGTGTKTSNKVSVKIPTKLAYTIEKTQRLAGESAYNKNELTGKYGQKVEYKIAVKNTGNVPLKFGALNDSACENVSPSGATEVGVGKEEAFTCEHTLTSTGSYSNEASIENTEGAGNKTSNKVTTTVKTEPNYTIEKLQKVGAEAFGNEKRNATDGQKVEYEIVIKNTGNVTLSFSNFVDAHCDAGTLAGGPSGPVKPNESAVYTCSHLLTTTDESNGSFSNEASITGNEGTGTRDIQQGRSGRAVEVQERQETAPLHRCPLALQRRRQPRQLEQRRQHRVRQTDQLRPAGDGRRTADQTGLGNQGRLGLPHPVQHRKMERHLRRRPDHLPPRGLRKRRNAAERTARNQAAGRELQRLQQRMVPERRTVQRGRLPGQSHDARDLRPARRKQRPAGQELVVDHRRRRDMGRLHDPRRKIGS